MGPQERLDDPTLEVTAETITITFLSALDAARRWSRLSRCKSNYGPQGLGITTLQRSHVSCGKTPPSYAVMD